MEVRQRTQRHDDSTLNEDHGSWTTSVTLIMITFEHEGHNCETHDSKGHTHDADDTPVHDDTDPHYPGDAKHGYDDTHARDETHPQSDTGYNLHLLNLVRSDGSGLHLVRP